MISGVGSSGSESRNRGVAVVVGEKVQERKKRKGLRSARSRSKAAQR